MLFWIICALMTTIAVALVLRPLVVVPGRGSDSDAADINVYRDQLEEVSRDVERGLIQPSEAEAARIEISRRLLSLTDEASKPDEPVPSAAGSTISAVPLYAAAGFVVIASLVAYLSLGQPGLPDTSYAARAKQDPRRASVDEQIARVEARLREHPDDGVGWDVIAPVYFKLQRFGDAINAYQRAIALRGATHRRLAGLAEASLALTNGNVTPEVRDVLTKLVALRPDDVMARFWLAAGKEQEGDKKAAISGYQALLADAKTSDRLRELLRSRLSELGAKVPPTAGQPGAIPAPDGQAAGAIAALPPEERLKAIRGMVAGLADRLAQNGNDPMGWKRLIRAYTVLGEREKAQGAFDSARKALAGDTPALAEIEAFAKSLGLKS